MNEPRADGLVLLADAIRLLSESAHALGDLHDHLPRLRSIRGPVDLAPGLLNRSFELFEIAVQVGKRVLLDVLGVSAQPVAVG